MSGPLTVSLAMSTYLLRERSFQANIGPSSKKSGKAVHSSDANF